MDKKQYTTGIPMEQVQIEDAFWGRILETVRTRLIPYQWEALNDRVEGAEPSYCLRNFRVAAGKERERSQAVFSRTAMWRNGSKQRRIRSSRIRIQPWRLRWMRPWIRSSVRSSRTDTWIPIISSMVLRSAGPICETIMSSTARDICWRRRSRIIGRRGSAGSSMPCCGMWI